MGCHFLLQGIFLTQDRTQVSRTAGRFFPIIRASLIAQLVKNLPAMQETPVQFLGWEDPLEKGKATHSSILGFPWWFSW